MFKYVIMVLELLAMEYMNAVENNARQELFGPHQRRQPRPCAGASPVRAAALVLIGEEGWNSIQETLRLYSIPGLVESIHEASAAPESDFTPMEDMQWE